MRYTLLAGALCFALLSPVYLPAITPAYAQEAAPCVTLADIIPVLSEPFVVIDEPAAVTAMVEMLVGKGAFDAEFGASVTKVLLAKLTGPDGVQRGYYGIEAAGCFSPNPVLLPDGMVVPVTQRLSGRYKFGTFA